MARAIPPERFSHLIEVAAATFISRGYRHTQMAEVAERLGVAKGTLYGYVESKDALLDCVIRFADGRGELPQPQALPVRTPPAGETARYVQTRLAAEAADMALVKAVQGTLAVDDPVQELTVVLSDLYSRLARNRHVIKVIDRCAIDHPELAEAWFGQGRWAQHQLLSQLIRRRVEDGSYRQLDQVDVIARTLLEVIAFWALHRHFDASPQEVDDASAQRVVIDLLVRGLLETST